MKTTSLTKATALGALGLAVAAFAVSEPAEAGRGDKEKCYGIVKAGANGCANAQKTHSCAGQSTVDGDWGEWIKLPKGTCERIVGGSLTPQQPE